MGNSLPSSPLLCGVLNMEKEIEDMITGNRWKQAYEVSELSSTCPLPFFEWGGKFAIGKYIYTYFLYTADRMVIVLMVNSHLLPTGIL